MKKIFIDIIACVAMISALAACNTEKPGNEEGKEEDKVPAVSAFERNVCIMEFTGTWCTFCPSAATTVNYMVSDAYKDRAYALAFHIEDEYSISEGKRLYNGFGLTSAPSYSIDMRDHGYFSDGEFSIDIDKALYDNPVHCAAAVECSCDSDGQVKVSAKMFSEMKSSYSIAAYVIEDKIIGRQTMPNTQVDQNYTHRHVVRKMLSGSINGDSLGEVEAGKEAEKEYSFTIEEGWKKENLSVAVLVITQKGKVGNMAVCAADGGKMDYKYVK
jgi:hypothetical protein